MVAEAAAYLADMTWVDPASGLAGEVRRRFRLTLASPDHLPPYQVRGRFFAISQFPFVAPTGRFHFTSRNG